MTKIFLILLLCIALIFTRFYNLPATSRFTRDESSNLVDMHRIYVQKELTLIGPIDVASYIIYPSLTFYMLMPFAIIGNFTTYSPALGTAFYGVLTVFLFLYLARNVNQKLKFALTFLLIFWFPLVEAARWAWNPHLVPFVSVLGLIFWSRKGKWFKLLAGLFFGLAFHLHYFSLVSSSAFMALASINLLKEKRFKEILFPAAGFIITIIPFFIFDLRNPPGLFFGRFLHNNLVSQGLSSKLLTLVTVIPQNLSKALLYLTQNQTLALLAGILILLILLLDLKNKNRGPVYLLPFIAQVVAIALLPEFAGRYVLLALAFLVLWLLVPRPTKAQVLSLLLVTIFTLGSIFNLKTLLTKPQIEPGAAIVEQASQVIGDKIKLLDLKNVNLAIIGSPDPDPFGTTYRHTLLVKEVRILLPGEYSLTDNLFVVSTQDEERVRNDRASIMNGFRQGKLVTKQDLTATNWKVYLFNRDSVPIQK